MLMAPVAWFLQIRRFVQTYRHVFSGFYTALFVLIMAIWALLDLALNSGGMREATGVFMFYPLLYIGWTVLRDIVTHFWHGLVWCVQRLVRMVRRVP